MKFFTDFAKLLIAIITTIVTIPASAESPSASMPPRNGVFFCKLTPPRTTFPKDITPTEAKLMQDHAAYWRGLLSEERVVVFGPVEDPAGTFGIVILRASSETEARGLANNDPVVKANIGFKYDVFATQAVTKPKA